MRSIIIILLSLVCSMAVTTKNAYTSENPWEFADIHIAPIFNAGLLGPFGGYMGGSGNWSDVPTAMDWSIGNTVPLSPIATNDMVFSTTIGSWVNPLDWKERMRITKDGRVGIGTAGPGARLDVDTDDGENVKALLVRQQDTFNNPVAVEIRNDGTGDSLVVDTNDLVVSGNGDVGIGTPNPATKLNIKQSGDTGTASTPLKIEASTDDTGLFLGYRGPGASYAQDTLGIFASFGSTGSYKPLTFSTRDTERMRITTSGDVGIGTSGPQGTLHIHDEVFPSITLSDFSDDMTISYSNFTGTGVAAIRNYVGDVQLETKGWFRLTNEANVIGTWGNYHVASDIRLKKDVVTISNALEKVSKLRGVNFRWKDGSDDDTQQMGMVAQEVEKIVPEVVHTANDGMKTKAVEYQYLVGLLVEASKELKAENEQLRETLTAMADRQKSIEDMLLALSTTPSNEKLVKLDKINIDEVKKTIQ